MEQTALITGASRRVGKSIAEHLASGGWHIIVHFNTSERPALELEEELKKKYPGQKFYRIQTNLADEQEVMELIPRAVRDFGKFQLLVNNASVFDPGYITETSAELFNTQLNVNLKAPFILTRDFATHC